MPLDLSMMKPEPFPYPLCMRSDLHFQKQRAGRERWDGRASSARRAVRALFRQCGEKNGMAKMVKTVFSIAGACAFGGLAIGVFWMAVEMDNSSLQSAKSSCSERR